jgi:enamine deaminase RidA (YjgF/YER057c/UK114 family)
VKIVNPAELMASGALPGPSLLAQFDGALRNVVVTLTAAGARPSGVVWLQVFVTDVAEYRAITRELGPVWGRHFGRHYPAMGLFGVTELADPDAVVELMGIAVIEDVESLAP